MPAREQEMSLAESRQMLLALFVMSAVNAGILAFVILRSSWTGWPLTLAIFIILFGVLTVMTQMETAVFVKLPHGLLPRLFLMGAIFSALLAPLAVLIFGKHRSPTSVAKSAPQLRLPTTEWIWKLSLIAVVYVAIYFSFGYFIAWRNPAVRAYYGGGDPGSFLAQMISVLRDQSWLVLLQLFRGLLWAALAVLIINMLRSTGPEAGLAVALVFGVLMTTQLLLPNPLMPEAVRLAHLIETSTSNFLFGLIIVWILRAGSFVKRRNLLSVPDAG